LPYRYPNAIANVIPLLTAFVVTSVDESTAKFVLAADAVIAPVPPSEIGIKSAATNSASPVTAEPVNVALIGVFDAISYP